MLWVLWLLTALGAPLTVQGMLPYQRANFLLQPAWGARGYNGSLLIEVKVPESVSTADTDLCFATIVDEDCEGRERREYREWQRHAALACGDPFDGKIRARLQAACWYVVAVLKRKGRDEVVAEGSSWARLVFSDEDSEQFVRKTRLVEEMKGRLGVFERAVNEIGKKRNQGLVLEFGGGEFSTPTLARLLGGIGRTKRPFLYTFDWWNGLPRRWKDDFEKGHFSRGGKAPPVVEMVGKEGKVELVNGLVESTLGNFVKSRSIDTFVDLVVIDTNLGETAELILKEVVKWMRPGTLVLFGSYLNVEGWGEHDAWVTAAASAGISFEYVTFHATWLLVRVNGTRNIELVAEEHGAKFGRVRTILMVLAVLCLLTVGFGLLFKQRQIQRKPAFVSKEKSSSGKKTKRMVVNTDPVLTGMRENFKEFCSSCAAVELERQSALDCENVVEKEVLQRKCLDLLSSTLVQGTKLQVAFISNLENRRVNRAPLVDVHDDLAVVLASLNVQEAELRVALEREPPVMLKDGASDAHTCVICLENAKCMLLLPCAHLCLCAACVGAVHACPICRQTISQTLKVFL
jgi:hypothetical protein